MLPGQIEIEPVVAPTHCDLAVPGSKSITNRALILAVLGSGTTTLRGALWSEDTQVMIQALHQLGADVEIARDPAEFSNRTLTVTGLGDRVPQGGNETAPLEIYVGNAGTAARFLAAFVCLGTGVFKLHGTARMHERPQQPLFRALRELGYRVDSANDRLPAVIHGAGWKPGSCHVTLEGSSQFASALLLSARRGGWQVRIVGEDLDEAPYVAMTERLIEVFPRHGGEFEIEPDASSGSYFWAAGHLLGQGRPVGMPIRFGS